MWKWLAASAFGLIAIAALVTSLGLHQDDASTYCAWVSVLSFVAMLLSIIAIVRGGTTGAMLAGLFGTVFSIAVWFVGVIWMQLTEVWHWTGGGGGGGGWGLGGGAWGRPLRVRGRQLHPSLTEGADWTHGPRPDARELDLATRRALEALWLHDAQKEHASVPAFSRVSWLIAAAGGPAELMAWSHRAAIEEIEHARACFALAAGYGGRSFTVEPMPELLLGGLDGKIDPRITLAIESLSDGCQLEDFNADVAAACARVCEEPVTRAALEMIAREERSHAELSWSIVAWLVERHRAVVAAPLAKASQDLAQYPRPTAVGADKRELVARAEEAALRRHGRLPDATWAAIWDERLLATRARLAALLGETAARAA